MKNFNFTRIYLLIISLLILISIYKSQKYLLIVLIIFSLFTLNSQAKIIVNLSETNPKIKTFKFLNIFTCFSFILVTIIALLSPDKQIIITEYNKTLVMGLTSLFMIIFGNLSPKIPLNRFLGLRLPWTIRDEETWRIAHRLTGYLSFPIAILMFTMSFFFNPTLVGVLGILIWIIVPSMYSFKFYKNKFKNLK